ncbi:MAG TPA: phosphoenolpyruvate carboxykinase (GTP), partial [Candidatus Omnitrophica bacterium]|nr:phosphoenolpyruvate carboxykinase (GTP) [Candidatus Omnitrophota bacterium]
MRQEYIDILKTRCSRDNINKLIELKNEALLEFIVKYIKLCNPDSVFVRTDSKEDARYIKDKAIELKEEIKLKTSGHTVHFDGFFDQARDKENTRYLLDKSVDLGPHINRVDKQKGINEIHTYLENIMKGKEVYICFFCLGPVNSIFSIPAVQITDSSYVAHSEDILYRSGYSQFKRLRQKDDFFKFVHSAGEL